jgi:hypothetical protein
MNVNSPARKEYGALDIEFIKIMIQEPKFLKICIYITKSRWEENLKTIIYLK